MSTETPEALRVAIRRLASGEALSADESAAAFGAVMSGTATSAQIAALLVGLRVRGETADEVAGAVRALRSAMVHLPADSPGELVDTCGTGGGTISTFNISTAAALLAAGAGVRIAKHGNRSFTSQCGSADVLEALGVNIDVPVETMAYALREAGIVFMFAPLMHPAMRHVGPVRRELAIPTLMNIVGPLANPAGAGRQVIGVADERRLPLIAGALQRLGTVHALVVHGEGMDEISPLGTTQGIEIKGSSVAPWETNPDRHGLALASSSELGGGDPRCNADVILSVLSGERRDGAATAVVLNAGAAMYVGGCAADMDDGIAQARYALRDGAGLRALERLRRAYGGQ